MPTFQVTCRACHEDRWPTLPKRPTTYTCTRCMAVPEKTRLRRRQQGQKAAETIQRNRTRKPAG